MLSAERRRSRQRLDEKLLQFKELSSLAVPPKGWIRAIRDALGMSAVQFGRQLGVAPQSAEDLERSEASGGIRLESLRRAAEALDCTLVYALVPKTSLQQAVDQRARKLAIRSLDRVDQTMALESQRVEGLDREALIGDFIREHLRDRDIWNL